MREAEMFRCSIPCHIESEKRISSCSSVESRALRTGNLEGVAGRDVTIKMHFYSTVYYENLCSVRFAQSGKHIVLEQKTSI